MTVTTRRFLYLAFTLLFLGASAVMLFFAAGYRYDWRHGRTYRPGIIVLESEPRPTRIVLDGAALRSAGQPARIGGLATGVHTVRLERDGYHPWEARLDVQEGRATTVLNIRLFRDREPTLVAEHVRRFVVSPDGRTTALLEETEPMLAIMRIDSREITPVLRQLPGTLDDLQWSADSSRLLLRTTLDGVQTLRSVDSAGTLVTFPLNLLATDRLEPSKRNAEAVWRLRDGVLFFTIPSTNATTAVAEHVLDWLETGDRTLVITETGSLRELRMDNRTEPAIVLAELGRIGAPTFLRASPNGIVTILDPSARRLLLVRRNVTPVTILSIENIVTAEWDSSFSRLLLANEHELFLLERDATDPLLLRRSGAPYTTAHWAADSTSLLVLQEGHVLLIDARGLVDPLRIVNGSIDAVAVLPGGDGALVIAGGVISLLVL